MPVRPEIGQRGGQVFQVLESIRTTVADMGGGGGRVACTVLKELLQNADDAGASEVSVLLDERDSRRVVELCPGYEALCTPALLVRNNRHFRLPGERSADDRGDFAAICDVAIGHKRAQATAAGRFGIGFNSVYFLTDTPLLFSRREIHIFDLLHRIFEDDGWRFPLDQFPRSSGSLVGPIKEVLDWCLPVAALESDSLGKIAGNPMGDYMQSVFRLPLRQSQDGQAAIYDDRFRSEVDRNSVILDMIQEAVRSIIFLKNVCTVSFGILRDRQPEMVTTIRATPPPNSFAEFLGHVVGQSGQAGCSPGRECEFERVVTREPFQFQGVTQALEAAWRFHIRHVARYDEAKLGILRERLELNGERAVPWAAVAVPLDVQGCCVDGGKSAKWRVFLPLLEEGPSACLIHGAFFVGRNRHQTDFRTDGSDEGKRKTEWNKRLFECAVLPLLQDISADLPDLAPDLLAQHPGEYLSLFPVASKEDGEATDLTEFARRCFAAGPWELHLKDIWNGGLDLLVGADGAETIVEMIPEGLVAYRERFRELSSDRRRFVTHALGKALWARVGAERGIAFRWQADVDVVLRILRHAEAPRPEDLERLLKAVVAGGDVLGNLEAVWAFQEAEGEELLRFEGKRLYILEETGADPVIGHLRGMGLDFEEAEWVRAGVGLAGLLGDIHPALKNVWRPTAEAALELLRRLPEANRHDQVAHDYEIRPVVDFLVRRPQGEVTADLRLGFLVRTGHAQAERRGVGVILLKPGKPTATEDALWEVWFQRVFAHLDPEFQRELQRLTAKHPGSLEALHAADCRVVVAHDRQAFDILHDARLKEPAVCAKLEEEMTAAAKKHPEAAERVSAWLLENADAAWEEMDEARRYTVLALPIHRCSDGQFIALSAASGGEIGSAGREFRLQSEDDIEDAPITLPACRLLQSANSLVKRFYRLRLGIKVHGRIEVLKKTLRQIGEPDLDNLKLLRYLDRYYEATVRALDQSGDAGDEADARELRALMSAARTVPCLDGKWRTAAECGEAWQMADHLAVQGWRTAELGKLLLRLLWGHNIAGIEPQFRELLPRLHRLANWDTRRIAGLAITSECGDLGLGDRVKLFWDNRRDLPDAGVVRSEAAGKLLVPALGGPVALAESELVAGAGDMPGGVLRLLAPKAIALSSLAGQLAISGLQAEDLQVVLRAFRVSEIGAADLDDRLEERFGEVWARHGDEERLSLLRFVDARGLTARLAGKAAELETVRVGGRNAPWKVPTKVISPDWATKKPPHVGLDRAPALQNVAEGVVRVWGQWCGLRSLGAVLDLVMEGATRAGLEERSAGKAVHEWLKEVIGRSAKEEEFAVLRTRAWVLAQRGEILQFKKPEEVLIHPGEEVLGARFWVPALPLPEFCQRGSERLGFATAPSATAADLVEIGECLVERADAEESAVVRVYELVVRLVEGSETLGRQWRSIAERRQVYRMFRERQGTVTCGELFIGDNEYKEDLSGKLLRLKSSPRLPAGVIEHYRRLGVGDRPSMAQVVGALGALRASERNAAGCYARLVRALQKVGAEEDVVLDETLLRTIRVLTCAGTYEPIAECYWDDEFGREERVITEDAALLIDATDRPTLGLVEWLGERCPGVFTRLQAIARSESADIPVPVAVAPAIEDLLYPWRQWLKDLADPDSAIRSRLAELGASPPEKEIEILPVEKIRVRWRLKDGQGIEQSSGWDGPAALAVADGQLLIRVSALEFGSQKASARIGEVDYAIACEVGGVLSGARTQGDGGPMVAEILKRIERPWTVLRQLHDNYREHFLHQYYDQVADPKFAKLFDEYRRTDPRRQRAEELKSEMFELLVAQFVPARAEQIRAYGYDEFSVFAELIQNAEDAYLQSEQLRMGTPRPFWVAYRYVQDDRGGRVLEVEHQGRPFNHGSRHDPNFGKDVEGVLRSAGSFKPHVGIGSVTPTNTRAIGRFGLGFKSVYLLTDCPEIHSGAWHFAIKAGCLPEELPRLANLPHQTTRIRLPLRCGAEVLDQAERLLDLVPFLSMVTELRFHPLSGDPASVRVESQVVREDESTTVEELTIALQGMERGGPVRLLRCRNQDHEGQLALVLNDVGIPVRWCEAFEHDVYVALPLQAKLSCGVAVSHRFEVQSGRTHLVDPAKNRGKMDEAAELLDGLVEGLLSRRGKAVAPSELLRRFWGMWKWDESDSECKHLSKALARVLAQLAERKQIVPTLDPDSPGMLGKTPCVDFSQVPDRFRDALIDAHVRIEIAGKPAQELERGIVAEAGFAAAYARACAFGEVERSSALCGIGWAEVSKAFRDAPLFAQKPELLNCLASTLDQEKRVQVAKWVALCEVLTQGGDRPGERHVPGSLLEPTFPGMELLPLRGLERVSEKYDSGAIELLKFAGLRSEPSAEELRACMQLTDLKQEEAVGILGYLVDGRRFAKVYNDLEPSARGAWFPWGGKRITVREAVAKELIGGEVIADDLFKTWLGLLTSEEAEAVEGGGEETREPEPINPKEVLENLFMWWQGNGASWTADYESRLYGGGRRPRLMPFDERSSDDRRGWVTLFVVGSLHKIGRTRVEQHRGFIERCEHNGWLDVFADGNRDAQRWMSVLDEYLDDPSEDERYRQWMRQFVDIYQISHWLKQYVESFRNIDRLGRPFALDEILAPRTNADFAGGGPDAPSLRRALGIGACFVVRELMRFSVLADTRAHKYCYMPTRRVRGVMGMMGCQSLEGEAHAVQSAVIHSFLVKHLGAKRSTFGGSFDLPLQALAEDRQLQARLLGREIEDDDEDVIFRTHPLGYVYPIRV